MPATTDTTTLHAACWVCGPDRADGLGVDFQPDGDHGVQGAFACPIRYEGYPGLLHGGVTSALLDGAMTNCLLATGCPGVTADLHVRYHHPVRIETAVTVHARWIGQRGPVQLLTAELIQDGAVAASAQGKFLEPRA